ncbi:MAG TPA: insulinase family protein [Candidatus Eisenbacteria bacterium]|nr:insulinase family protein [Candidatus Eisenbacteria bacterium]
MRSRSLIPSLAVALAMIAALAVPPAGIPGALAAPHLVRALPSKSTIVIRENRTRPLVTVQAWVKSGARDEVSSDRGVSSVLTRMLPNATKKYGQGRIQRELAAFGAEMSTEVGYTHTMYQITAPAKYFGTAVDLLSEILIRPRMEGQDLNQGVARARMDASAVLQASERFAVNPAREAIHAGTPLVAPVAVPELEIQRITLPLAQRFYQNHYVAENMMFVVVGDVEPEDAARRIETAFRDMPKGKAPSRKNAKAKDLKDTKVIFAAAPDGVQGSTVNAAFRSPAWGTADAIALDVLLALLVESPESRARKRLDEEGGGLTHAIAQRSFELDGGTVTVSFGAQPDRMKDAESALLALLEQSRSQTITQEELQSAVNSVLSRELYGRSELSGIGRATALAVLQGKPGADEVYAERVRAVRPEDLVAVANLYLNLDKAAIVEVMPASTADSLGVRRGYEDRIKEALKVNRSAYGKGPTVSQSDASARRARIDAPLAKIPSAPFDPGRARVDRTVLAGGLRLLHSEDRSVPMVTVAVYLAGGVRYENEKNNGVTSLIREALLTSRDPKAGGAPYRVSLVGLGNVQPYQDRDMWGLSIAVPATRWKETVERLGAMFARPELDTTTVDATRIHLLTGLDRWLEDDQAQRARLIFPTKYHVSGYRLPGLGTRRTLLTMPQDEVEGWYRKFVVRENLVVAVFGDVRPGEAAPVVDAAFRDVSSKPFRPGTVPKEPEFDGFRERWELGQGPDNTVTLAYNGPPAASPDIPALYVANSILSGPHGFFETHLNSSIYFKSSTSIVSQAVDESPIIATANIVGPVQEENGVKLLFRQFKKVAFLNFGTGEYADTLRYAKTHASGQYLSLLRSNTARAFQVGRSELFGLGVDYPITLPARIEAVSGDDIRRIGMRYFDRDEFTHRPYAIAETRPGGW